MTDTLPSIIILGFTLVLHVVMANLDIGLIGIIPFMKRWGETKGKPHLVDESKKYMKYVGITYATAGMMATAFTIFLLSFYPDFIWLAGMTLFTPFLLAAIFVSIRLFLISAYWYSWDRLEPKKHYWMGLVLASTSILVPFAFRLIFGFLNDGEAVTQINPDIKVDDLAFFTNATFWPLFLLSVFGAFSMTFFVLVSIYAYRMHKEKDKETKERYGKLLNDYLKYGTWTLIVQLFLGTWYFISLALMDDSFKFNNIAGFFVGKEAEGNNLSWLFAIKMLLVIAQVAIVLYFMFSKTADPLATKSKKMLVSLGPLAALTVILGELLNLLSHLPYFIAKPSLAADLPHIDLKQAINPLADAFDVYAVTVFALVPLLLAFGVLVYYAITVNAQKVES